MTKIFLAFGGIKDQNKDKNKIITKDNLVLLNLEKFNKEELNKYLIEQEISLPYEQIPKEIIYDSKVFYSWGIIFEFENEEINDEFLFLLELYLGAFLNPIFKFHRLGFEKLKSNSFSWSLDGYLSKIDIEKLYNFLNDFKGIVDYSYWLRPRIYDWVKNKKEESFRLYTGFQLYKELKYYSYGKSITFWKKEVMEIGIVFETLFTQPNEKESIGYTLKKRIHFLSIDLIDNIENKIKEIYKSRSDFVHGSIFGELKKQYDIVGCGDEEDIKEKINKDMFDKTIEYINILRKILLLYYKLFDGINKGEYNSYFKSGCKITCIDIIELSMFNNEIKNKFQENIKLVNSLIEY